MKTNSISGKQNLVGTWYAILAFGLWGILPTYWKLLQEVSPYEIVAHRVLWTCLFTGSLLLVRRKWMTPAANKGPGSSKTGKHDEKVSFLRKILQNITKDKAKMRRVIFCALLLGINWLTFVYAINSDKVLDASMGYYINPLISVFLGLIVLKEKVNFWQKISIILAFIGVFIIIFQYGRIPWIALTLAFTFGLYGLIKKGSATPAVKGSAIPTASGPGCSKTGSQNKKVSFLSNPSQGMGEKNGGVDAVTGLYLETLLMVPFSLVFILITFVNGEGALVTGSGSTILLLISTGFITGIPLLFFAGAVQRIPLSRVGFIQYLTPTCFFLLGRFVYREAFSTSQFISFIFIWVALALYSLSGTVFMRKLQKTFTGRGAR